MSATERPSDVALSIAPRLTALTPELSRAEGVGLE